MFWNPQDEQIPKLSLESQFDQDLIEKIKKHLVDFLMISTVYRGGVSDKLSLYFSRGVALNLEALLLKIKASHLSYQIWSLKYPLWSKLE